MLYSDLNLGAFLFDGDALRDTGSIQEKIAVHVSVLSGVIRIPAAGVLSSVRRGMF